MDGGGGVLHCRGRPLWDSNILKSAGDKRLIPCLITGSSGILILSGTSHSVSGRLLDFTSGLCICTELSRILGSELSLCLSDSL